MWWYHTLPTFIICVRPLGYTNCIAYLRLCEIAIFP